MTSLWIFLSKLRGLFLKRRLEQEMQDEFAAHLEMQIEDHLSQGMTPEEARYLALRKFGGVEQVKEIYRERRSLIGVETLIRDLKYGLRMMRRSRGVTAVAILSLALGIGANTALFSVVDAVLLKTLPVADAEQLVIFEWLAGRLYRTGGMSGTSNVDVPAVMRRLSQFRNYVFEKLHTAQNATPEAPLTDLFAFAPLPKLTVNLGEQAEIIDGQAVSGNYHNGLRLN